MDLFLATPAPLSLWQRQLVILTTLMVAASRFLALSASAWDWDEALFSLALRDFDVVHHHPHPPGFPVYVAMAKAVSLFTPSEFLAFRTVVLIGALALFPLAFLFAYELRLSFRTSYLGALLFAFLPNVWLYGGTAFSDVPGTALILGALTLLLRGCRDERAYLAGAVVLGCSAGVRPQALLIGCAPALLASYFQFRQSRRRFVLACLLGTAVLAVSYGGAAIASASTEEYLDAWDALGEYVRKVDSFLNPDRPPLAALAREVFLRPTRGGRICYLVSGLALIGVFHRRPGIGMLLLTFAPFAVFAWLMLDQYSIGRYAIGYVALYALLASAGAEKVASLFGARQGVVQSLLIGALIVRFAWWTWPALYTVRETVSPPMAALQWAEANAGRIFADRSVKPHAALMLPLKRVTAVETVDAMPMEVARPGDYYVTEDVSSVEGSRVFRRPHGRVWEIARRRYFEVSVIPASALPRYVDGWYDYEITNERIWRWMGNRSRTLLAPANGQARLLLQLVTVRGLPTRPTIEIRINGKLIDRFVCEERKLDREWTVPARADALNELEIVTDQIATPPGDDRQLGLELRAIGWGPATRESLPRRSIRVAEPHARPVPRDHL